MASGSASARALAKPAIVTASTQLSVPPASITSASPLCTARNASPTACAPAAHAVAAARFGPRKSCRMLTCPAAALHRTRGTKNGESFFFSVPRSSRRPACVTSETWPMPLPMLTPHRSGSRKNGSRDADAVVDGRDRVDDDAIPASAVASAAAHSANPANGATEGAAHHSARSKGSSGFVDSWRRGTTAATRTPSWPYPSRPSGTSSGPMNRTPDSPFMSDAHVRAVPAPSGVTSPMPVTTTRRCGGRGGGSRKCESPAEAGPAEASVAGAPATSEGADADQRRARQAPARRARSTAAARARGASAARHARVAATRDARRIAPERAPRSAPREANAAKKREAVAKSKSSVSAVGCSAAELQAQVSDISVSEDR